MKREREKKRFVGEPIPVLVQPILMDAYLPDAPNTGRQSCELVDITTTPITNATTPNSKIRTTIYAGLGSFISRSAPISPR